MTNATQTARDYYNSGDADSFYASIWGGEDIHIGLYDTPEDPIRDASHKTVHRMAQLLAPTATTRLIDLGSGYGGAARFLAHSFGTHVTCLNLSEVQNHRARRLNQDQRLADRIDVIDGSFDTIPFPSATFDAAWSQDALLHAADRSAVLREIDRVLQPGARFVFTDPMAAEETTPDSIRPILDRLHLPSLATPTFYMSGAQQLGWSCLSWLDLSHQLSHHYARVLESLESSPHLTCSPEYVERMKSGLRHWIHGGREGLLRWGIFLFQKNPS